MGERISLIDEICNGKYEASVITTFNIYFPFYEQIILRHLETIGCRYNLLLVDAKECQINLESPTLRPRLAGKRYSLLPVFVKNVFHPKIVLLIGKEKSLLLVGSHNVTIAGYSSNKEITNRFERVKNNKNKDIDIIFQSVWRFIKKCLESLPEQITDNFKEIEHIADWLQEPIDPILPSRNMFFGTPPEGLSLWEQLKPNLPKKSQSIFLMGPFFDQKLYFLQLLKEHFSPTQLVVGIDPETVSIGKEAKELFSDVTFVNASSLSLKETNSVSGYLHAKAILIESEENEVFLITGSANPTKAAWFGTKEERNIEAIVLRIDIKGSLGELEDNLRDLINKPKISNEDWKIIKNNPQYPYQSAISLSVPIIAVVTEKGLEIDLQGQAKENIKSIVFFDNKDKEVYKIDFPIQALHQTQLILDVNVTSKWCFFIIYFTNEKQVYGTIHHKNELQTLAKTSKQKIIERALDSLNSDTPLFEDLVSTILKVIDEPIENIQSNISKPNHKELASKIDVIQTSFVSDLNEKIKQKNHPIRIASKEMSVILDILLHHLSKNLDKDYTNEQELYLESEEELIGSEEETDYQKRDADKQVDIDRYQRKVKTLLDRVLKHTKAAFEDKARCSKVIPQICAILALLNHLYFLNENNAPWIPRGRTFLEKSLLLEFLSDITPFLYDKNNGLISFAKLNIYQGNFEELISIRSFLLWLAWISGLSIAFPINKKDFKISNGNKNLLGWKSLACIALESINNREVYSKTLNLVNCLEMDSSKLKQNEEWIRKCQVWAEKIQTNLNVKNTYLSNTKPLAPGDIVIATSLLDSSLYIVLENQIKKVVVSFLDKDKNTAFQPEKLFKVGSISE